MFVTKGQFFVFLACISIGCVCGLIYSLFDLFKKLINKKIFCIIFDVCFFVCSCVIYIYFQWILDFPSIKLYMIFSVFLGMFLYYKSFYIILANIIKKLYNKISKILKKITFFLKKKCSKLIKVGKND